MLEMLPSADDVLALKIAGKIEGDELVTIMDRLDAMMAKHDKTHVFVETHAIEGVEMASLGPYMMRAMPLFGKLDRFGRVAVVADQSWVHFRSKVESMLLPHVQYRVFEPDARDAAWAWVTEGRES